MRPAPPFARAFDPPVSCTLRRPRRADAQGSKADSDPTGSDLEDSRGDLGAV